MCHEYKLVFCLFVSVLTGCDKAMAPSVPRELHLQTYGRLDPALFSDSKFVLGVYHQHAGTVHNGSVEVTVYRYNDETFLQPVEPHETQTWSFDSWPPNKEAVHEFPFSVKANGPVTGLGPEQKLRFKIGVKTADADNSTYSLYWVGGDWIDPK